MGRGRQLTHRGKERRDNLLAYATERFAANGFHPTSVSDIVDGVGVGKGVFYWYFDSKDQLLIEILRESLRDLRTAQADAMEGHDDPLEQLEAGIRASVRWSAANTDITKLVMFGRSEQSFAEVLGRGQEIVVADTARLIERAMAAGRIAEGDPTMMARAIRAIIDQLAQEYATSDGDVDLAAVETIVRMCLRGIEG